MTKYKIDEIIKLIEQNIDINNLFYNNIHLWPIIRINLQMNLMNYSINKTVTTMDFYKKIFYKIKILILSLVKIFYYILFKSSKIKEQKIDYLFYTYSAAKRIKLGGKNYDVFCDPIIDSINTKNTYLKIEITNDFNYRLPNYYTSYLIQPIIIFYQFISFVSHFFLSLSKETIIILNDLREFLFKLESENLLPSYRVILFNSIFIFFLSKFFENILRKVNPKLIFSVSSYGPVGMALVVASKKFDIPLIEIQHGYMGALHPAYSNWDKVPDLNYNVLSNYYYVWSDAEKFTIESWLNKVRSPNKVFISGNIFLN